MKKIVATGLAALIASAGLGLATPAEAGTAVPTSTWASCSRHFELRKFSDHVGGYGYFVNCTSKTIYVRADLANGPDPSDRKLAPGQRGSWSDNPRVGTGTSFRRWKVCTGSRCA